MRGESITKLHLCKYLLFISFTGSIVTFFDTVKIITAYIPQLRPAKYIS